MAGLDGIKNRIEPPEPVDKDLYELPPEEHANIAAGPRLAARGARRPREGPRVPARGDVFTEDLIETWIEYKRKNEVDPIRFRPHPHEFEMYFDI
jgi:glutamine synthetase